MTFPKHADGQRARARKAARHRASSEQVATVRAAVVAREGGMCRAALDGEAGAWCSRRGTDFHEASGLRGMGGRNAEARPVTTGKGILLCHACHMAHHDGRLRIEIDDADSPFGVWYALR